MTANAFVYVNAYACKYNNDDEYFKWNIFVEIGEKTTEKSVDN